MNPFFKIVALLTFGVLFVSSSLAQVITPQGRLTLVSGTPVMTTSIASTGVIYYTPYVGNSLPEPNGSGGYTNVPFSELTLELTSAEGLGGIYDVFAYYDSGWNICAGPVWGGGVPSITSRGTGAGTPELTMVGGILVNANTMPSCNNLSGGFSVPAQAGIYLGSFYGTGAGKTTANFRPAPANNGGTSTVVLFNAYNRVRATAMTQDSKSTWTDTSSSWRPADNSASNVINFLDGLEVFYPKARYSVCTTTNTNATSAYIGLNLDSTTSTPVYASGIILPSATGSSAPLNVEASFPPQLGLHSVTAMENTDATATLTFYGSIYGCEGLTLEVEY